MRFLSKQFTAQEANGLATVLPKDLHEFLKTIARLPTEEISEKYGIPYSEAETLYPSLLLYADFLSETKAEIFSSLGQHPGRLLLEMAQLVSGYKRTDLSRQVIHSARAWEEIQLQRTARSGVAAIALKLFDA